MPEWKAQCKTGREKEPTAGFADAEHLGLSAI